MVSIYHSIETDQEADKFVSTLIARLGELSASIARGVVYLHTTSELRDRLRAIVIPLNDYITTRGYSRVSDYLSLLICSSLYLCEMPEVAIEIVHTFSNSSFSGMQNVLYRMLLSCLSISEYDFDASDIYQLSKHVYEGGTPRELLLGDVIVSVMKKRYY